MIDDLGRGDAEPERAEPPPTGVEWAARTVTITAWLAFAIGVLVLIGWMAGIEVLTGILPSLPAMRIATAACLVALSVAVLLLRDGDPRAARLARVLAGTVVAIGALAIVSRAVPEWTWLSGAFPTSGEELGSPSISAGGGLILLALTAIALDLGGPRYRPGSVLAGASVVAAFFVAVGWIYDVDWLRGGGPTAGLALHTAFCFVLLAVALACLRPERPPVATIRGDVGIGAQGRRLMSVAIITPFAIGVGVLIAADNGLFGERAGSAIVTVLTTLLLFVLAVAFLRQERQAEYSRRLAESAIERRERVFRAVSDSAIEAIVTADADGAIVYVNPATERIFGWQAVELIGHPLTELMPERYRRQHLEGLRRYHETGERRVIGTTIEVEGLRRDGTIFPLSLSLSDWEVDGDLFFTGVIADISARVEAEEENRLLAELVEATDDAVLGKDLEGNILTWNAGAERLYGYSREEAVGRNVRFIAPPERPNEIDWIQERIGRGEIVQLDTERVRKDGKRLSVSLTISPVRNADGEIVGGSTISRDVTQRRRMEEAVAAERAALEEAQEIARVGSYELDPETAEVSFSRQMKVNYGFDPDGPSPTVEQAIARVHPDDRDRVAARNAELRENARPFTDEYRVVLDDGDVRTLEVRSSLSERDGRVIMAGTSRDVTAEREAERAKDEFFGLVSHELRTPLTSIIGYVDLLKDFEAANLGEQPRRWIDVIDRNARRQLRLVQDLLMLARLEARRFEITEEDVELGTVVRQHVEDATDDARAAGVELDFIDAGVGAIRGDAHRLGQVVENLLSNAIKFSPAGGRVTAELRDVGPDTVLEVSDEGIGIPEEEVDRVFERLFRASTASEMHVQGTGLGLTIAKAIVDEHGGTIGVSSRAGVGTRFRVVLPRRPAGERSPAGQIDDRRAAAIQDVRGD